MIVVDTNIIAYLYLKGQHTQHVEALVDQDPVWASPLLWQSEFCNVLTLYVRKKIITLHDAIEIIEQAKTLMSDNEYEVSPADVLELSKSSRCSAYDCEFVSLAKKLNVPMVTEDKQILADFPKIAVSLATVLSVK